MKFKWIGVFAFTWMSAFISGCGGSEDPSMTACKKLDLKCTKQYRDNTLNFELNKKINEFVDKRESEIQLKVSVVNNRLQKFTMRSFPVDVINYTDINKTRFNGLLVEEKLDGVKVFSSAASLFGSEIKVRAGIGKASTYESIKDICTKIELIKCKIAYAGKIDGVWTKKDDSGSVLSGWIELETVAVLPLTLKETKTAISNFVHQQVGRKIWESKGDVSWGQIEDMVEKRIAEIN